MKWTSTFRLILVAAAMLMVFSFAVPAVFAQAAAPATPAVDSPGKVRVLVNLIFENRDPVTWVIFLLSIVSVTFIVRGFIRTRESVVMPPETVVRIREMIESRQYQQLLEFTEGDTSFISKAVNPALKRAPQYTAMREAMETSVGEQTADSFRGIEILNIIGNLGPLLGLLGTVLGMIDAFAAMNRAGGTANPAQLAGGIATALAHTFLGLALAIPTLAAFGILRTMTDRLTSRAAIISEDLLILMKPADAKTPVQNVAPTMPPRPSMTR